MVQAIAYGESSDDDVDLLKIGLENVDVYTRVTQGYVVDFWTWRTSPGLKLQHHAHAPVL